MIDRLVIEIDAQAVASKQASIDCVVDLSGLGDVVGVEVISLAHLSGGRIGNAHGTALLNSVDEVHWSYDEESDAFYVKVKDERSLDQRCVQCTVEVDGAGLISKIIVDSHG